MTKEEYFRKHLVITTGKDIIFGEERKYAQALFDGCFITLADFPESYTAKEGDSVLNHLDEFNYEDILQKDWLIDFLYEKDVTKVCSFKDMDKYSDSNVACIGFSSKEQKWYGWSHREVYGFGVGDVIEEDNLACSSGFIESYEKEHPERCFNLKPGFKCETLNDCKKAAFAFAMSVA